VEVSYIRGHNDQSATIYYSTSTLYPTVCLKPNDCEGALFLGVPYSSSFRKKKDQVARCERGVDALRCASVYVSFMCVSVRLPVERRGNDQRRGQ